MSFMWQQGGHSKIFQVFQEFQEVSRSGVLYEFQINKYSFDQTLPWFGRRNRKS